MDNPFISFSKKNRAGVITLNRSESLNSLNLSMLSALKNQLSLWKDDREVQYVILKSSDEKALCAGGDLKEVYKAGRSKDSDFLHAFFEEEYSLNQLIFAYPKPYISLMSGIVMGGGLGITAHGSHRIVTETSLIAMPEVFIGFFPDAGGSYFLNKCPGKVGLFLGLSGYRMNGADALYAKIGTHYVASENLLLLEHALVDRDISANPRAGIDAILDAVASPLSIASPLEKNRDLIDDYFSEDDVGMLMARLRLSKSSWFHEIRKGMEKACPLSLCITAHLLRKAKGLAFKEAIKLEHKLALKFFENTEVLEGIRSVVIDKDRVPNWGYTSLCDISLELVDSYFD